MPIILIPIIVLALYTAERWLFGKYWDRGLSVEQEFAAEAVTEGDSAALREVITNRNFLPLHILQVNFQTDIGLEFGDETNMSVSDRVNVTDVFSLRFYEKVTRNLPFVGAKRGYYSILKTSVKASDLFSPDIRYTTIDQDTSMYVYPRMLPDGKVELPLNQLMGEALSKRFLYEDNFTFRGIRDYAPTDPQSNINWKATARSGGIKVNLHDYTASPEIMIVLNVEEPSILFETELLEDCIRLTLTMAAKLISQNVPVSLLTNGKDKITGEAIRLEAGASADHLRNFSRALARIDLIGHKTDLLSGRVQEELHRKKSSQLTCCYISTSKGDDAMKTAEILADEQGRVMWLCPLTRSMDTEHVDDDRIDYRVILHE